MSRFPVEEMAADYQSGLSLRKVGAKYGLASQSVRYLFRKRGIPTRTKGEAQTGRLSHRLKHGHSGGGQLSPTYMSWCAMLARCRNRSHPGYHNYGGRGITVCERWHAFDAFLADMGERPPGLEMERIDNSLGYEPGNCRWATRKENGRNRRTNRIIEADGKALPVSAWAELKGIPKGIIANRLRAGMPTWMVLYQGNLRELRVICR